MERRDFEVNVSIPRVLPEGHSLYLLVCDLGRAPDDTYRTIMDDVGSILAEDPAAGRGWRWFARERDGNTLTILLKVIEVPIHIEACEQIIKAAGGQVLRSHPL